MSNSRLKIRSSRAKHRTINAAFAGICVLIVFALVSRGAASAQSQPALQYQFTPINFPGAVSTAAQAINDKGEIVGVYASSSNTARQRGFLKTDQGMVTFDYPGGDSVATTLTGINSKGDIIGLHSVASGPTLIPVQGFIYDGSRFTDIHVPGGAGYTRLNGINDAGDLVGSLSEGDTEGFLYSNTGFSQIAYPDQYIAMTTPLGINNGGAIVGAIDCIGGGCETGFLLANGQYSKISMPDPNAAYTVAYAINNRGHIAGIWEDANFFGRGFVEIDGKFTSIEFPGAQFPNGMTAVAGINEHDVIVGTYYGGDCVNGWRGCGFVATPRKQ